MFRFAYLLIIGYRKYVTQKDSQVTQIRPYRSTHKWDTTRKTRGSTSGQDRSPRVVTSPQRICCPSVSLQASSDVVTTKHSCSLDGLIREQILASGEDPRGRGQVGRSPPTLWARRQSPSNTSRLGRGLYVHTKWYLSASSRFGHNGH